MTLRKTGYRPLVLLGGVSLALAACATSPSQGTQTVRERESLANDCIFPAATVRDFTALDDSNLILYGPGGRAYHVVLTTPSINLDTEFRIGVFDGGGAARDGRICPFGFDRIIVDGPLIEQIAIRSIETIDDDQVEALKVRYGREEAADEDLVTVTDVDPEDDG